MKLLTLILIIFKQTPILKLFPDKYSSQFLTTDSVNSAWYSGDNYFVFSNSDKTRNCLFPENEFNYLN